eukprot:4725511-Pyramimonas_sp.AAC.1
MGGMEQLATQMKNEGDWVRNTRRAVGDAGGADQYKQLAIATAKAVVGMDVLQRSFQGCLATTALVMECHPYLKGLQDTG